MKNLIVLIVAFIFFVSCGASPKERTTLKKPIVTVSIAPQKYFVEQIAGDYFDVNVILPPGSVPEDFEPTPRQVKKIANSEVYFYIGHLGFEKSWIKKFTDSAKGVKYVSCSHNIDLLRGDIHDHDHSKAEKQAQGTDPHIWTSPENVKKISRTIFEVLTNAHPDQKVVFEANLNNFISRIDTLDNAIRTTLNDSLNHSFMVFHPALSYFARDYHLQQHSIEFEGKSPSPAHMKEVVDIARKENLNTIFIQSQFETAKAEAIAKEIGAEIVPIDPLAENWMDEMHSLTAKLKKSFASKGVGKTN